MGDSLDVQINRVVPNWTKCLTWNKARKSQMEQDHNVVITFDDICGLLVVLAVGLFVAMLFISVELAVKAFKENNNKY